MRKARGEITKLSTLFDKYKKILKAPQGTVIESFIEVVEELVGIKIEKSRVTYKVHSRVLAVNAQGPLKNEIRLRKEEILAHLKGRLGEQSAPVEIL
jgi:hypothetical protein